jgi:uncharacterized PurR-regulated membrane protein YhhQ (DUF165 family)
MPDPKTNSQADTLGEMFALRGDYPVPQWLRSWWAGYGAVALFIMAVLVANLLVNRFGQVALPFTAFVLIPFDLVTRDVLHERWAAESRAVVYLYFLLLICGAGLGTLLVHSGAAWVVAGSIAGFSGATAANTVCYDLILTYRPEVSRFWRMTISNVFGAVADSILFPVVAFESVDAFLAVSQASAKSFGGVVWAMAYIALLRYTYR